MRTTLALLGLLIASSVLAQDIPSDCGAVLWELRGRPPGHGDQRRVSQLLSEYEARCEAELAYPLGADDMSAISKVLNPETLK